MIKVLHTGIHLKITMVIIILLFSAVYSQKKQEYGILTACVNKNQSLTIDCFYPFCDDKTPFNCNLSDTDGDIKTLIGSSDQEMVNSNVAFLNAESGLCRLIITDHAKIYCNKTKIYACGLSRKKSTEEKKITVKYGTRKEQPKDCPSGGPLSHVSGLLCIIAFLFFQKTYL